MICGLIWFQQKPLNQYGQQEVNQASQIQNPSRSLRGSELILCIKCYTEGNMPNVLSPHDFQRVDLLTKLNSSTSKTVNTSNWGPEETLRLLELIAKSNDNWNEIEKHFPNRTQEEIILHYLQLPIKNITSINISETNDENEDARTPIEKIADNQLNAFSDYSNPLLQHVKNSII